MPFIYYNTSGGEEWNSDTVGGGVIADVRTYSGTGSSDVLYYPIFAGRQVRVVGTQAYGAAGVTADTLLGYPRVTVASGYALRKFAVVVL